MILGTGRVVPRPVASRPIPSRPVPTLLVLSYFLFRHFPKEPSAAAELQVVEQFLHHLAATCCRAGHWQ